MKLIVEDCEGSGSVFTISVWEKPIGMNAVAMLQFEHTVNLGLPDSNSARVDLSMRCIRDLHAALGAILEKHSRL
jgi:hypothetical protein